jgi:fructose-specific component phosphotransferase system IIB-like protein
MSVSPAEIVAANGDHLMDRNSAAGGKRIILSDAEIAKRAPGGRLPLASAKSNALGENGWTSVTDGSPAAVAGEAERQVRRERPDLVARRQARGK